VNIEKTPCPRIFPMYLTSYRSEEDMRKAKQVISSIADKPEEHKAQIMKQFRVLRATKKLRTKTALRQLAVENNLYLASLERYERRVR